MKKRTYDHNGHTDLEISCSDLTDEQVASRVRMLMRGDLDHELVCVMARDRIKCLMKEKAELETAMTWQPIRTAPKDGTWFLCHQAGDDGVIRISSARWNGDELGGKGWSYSPHAMPQYWMPISERFAE